MIALTILTLLMVAVAPSEERTQSAKPQPVFVELEVPLLTVTPVQAPPSTSRTSALSGNYYFIEVQGEGGVVVVTPRGSKRLEFADYRHRPTKARWLNAKLVMLETSFNPHAGAYAIYDVEKDIIVASEAEHYDAGL